MSAPDPVDVVVVGSGAGGAPVALALARAGARVVVLEKGPDLKQEELVHDEIKMCRRNFFIPYAKDEPHLLRYGDGGKDTKSNEGWTSNVVGGGTVHMSGYFMRMQPVDFQLRSALGKVEGASLADWPLSYKQLEPWYHKAEVELGVSGQWKRHPFEEPRSSDYPLPPLDEHPFAQEIDKAGKKLGMHPFPTPRGIISRDYQGRLACMYCALCGSFGCEMGAKASTPSALLPEARKTGRCEIRARAMAQQIPVNDQGRAMGVVYIDEKKNRVFQEAKCVVVACSAVESARLLLSSQSGRFPKGLANGSGLVGRNLVFSGLSKAHGLFHFKGRADRKWMAAKAPFVQRSIQDFYWLQKPVAGLRKAGTLLFAFYHPNPINTAERVAGRGAQAIWGAALKQKLRDEARDSRCLDFETFAEYLPTSGTRVELEPGVTDRYGLPVARIVIGRHPLDHLAAGFLRDKGLALLRELGADSTTVTVDSGETKILQGGTCRFGTDPAASVLDPSCRAHEVDNLYVSDGSFLPNAGGVPFTLTILANAFRVGDGIAGRFKAGTL
jgi:choline dehydrogenase-like flavoprotein